MVRRRELTPKPIFDETALLEFLDRHDAKPSTLRKIWRAVMLDPKCELSAISDLPEKIRKPLSEEFANFTSKVKQKEVSADKTMKLLLQLGDGSEVEAVIIHHDTQTGRATLCVSSQVGCRMGCKFCATGTLGLTGNLWAGEIIEQLVHARLFRPDVSNIVFMGMGEPLENYTAVRSAVKAFIDPHFWSISPKSVTVSTVGVVHSMRQFLKDFPDVRLALSLHAPNQKLREDIVPSAKNFALDDLMDCVDEYNRRRKVKESSVMLEYVLIKDVNDSLACAHELVELVKDRSVVVNIIPYNKFEGNLYNYETPTEEGERAFHKVLLDAKVPVFLRRHHGRDISAACGQLAKLSATAKNSKAVWAIAGTVVLAALAVPLVRALRK